MTEAREKERREGTEREGQTGAFLLAEGVVGELWGDKGEWGEVT